MSLQKIAHHIGHTLCKAASDAVPVYHMAGRLYLSSSGWLLLKVPNSLGKGAFDALDEPGITLPTRDTDDPNAVFNAHISVMSAAEVESLGGGDKITERGHMFRYTLGPVKTVEPKTWNGVSKVWYITVYSPELRQLRKSYGLSPQPKEDWDFHVTIGIRKTGVLHRNEKSKAAEYTQIKVANADGAPYRERAELFNYSPQHGLYGGQFEDKTFGVPGGGIDEGEDIATAAAREFFEETGMRVKNPRLAPVDPVTSEWSESHRARLPPDRQKYRGSRTHFVLADPEDLTPGTDKLDKWSVSDRRFYGLEEALGLGEGKTPLVPAVFAARRKVLQHLLSQAKQAATDILPGGLADGKEDSEFDPQQLAKGRKVEQEHTTLPTLPNEIAKDHLTEDPKYYDKLEQMESKKAREFVPGEDCCGCGASMEKDENGYCNSCGCEYDTGKDKGNYGKEASIDENYLFELLLKEAASTHTFTHQRNDGTNTYDVLKLIEILKDRPTQLAALDALKVNRSRRSGYSPKRMAAANTTFPGIVNEQGQLVDGRHRAAKMIEHGQTHMPVRTATAVDLEAVKI